MPYYKISYTNSAGKVISGIRQFHLKSIDDTYTHFLQKAKQNDPDLTGFQCYMLSELSDEFKAWQATKKSKPTGKMGSIYNRKKSNDGPTLNERKQGI